jgi:hypothetical protein
MFFDTIKYTGLRQIVKAAIDTIPVDVLFLQSYPFTTVLCDILQCLKKIKVTNFNIAPLLWKQMLETLNKFIRPFHDEG